MRKGAGVKTYPLIYPDRFCIVRWRCICGAQDGRKDGKLHRYFSIVESRRLSTDCVAQRTVLYLRGINDKQEASWRKSLSVFDDDRQQYTTLSLFPEDRIIPEDAVGGIRVRLGEVELRNPRLFGNSGWDAVA